MQSMHFKRIASINYRNCFVFSRQVLQLMSLTDSRLPQTGCEKLELSMMSFLDHIRKIYIIEQMQKMKIYKRLSELLGINDEPMLLSVINRKMCVSFFRKFSNLTHLNSNRLFMIVLFFFCSQYYKS